MEPPITATSLESLFCQVRKNLNEKNAICSFFYSFRDIINSQNLIFKYVARPVPCSSTLLQVSPVRSACG